MIKRKWFGGIERNLSFVNEVSAGIGLVTGYVLFGLYWLSTPITTVEVTTQTVAYEERVIGYIPEPTRLESISDLGSLNRTVPVTAKFPILNEQGRPALSEEVVTFEGKGTPMIYVEQKEIVIPKLASDDVKLVSPHSSSNYARFYLETILQGTGYYYEDKRVAFDGAMSADIFAVRIGTLFALLSLVLLMIKVKAISRSVNFLKSLMEPDKSPDTLDEASMSEHYENAKKFKKQYEMTKRSREAEYFERIGESAEVAYANILTFIDKAELFLRTEQDNNEYVVCRDKSVYIDPPVYCDIPTVDRKTYMGITADPLDVKRCTLEEAEFFANYLKNVEGALSIEPVRLVKAIRNALRINLILRKKLEFYLRNKGII